MSDLDLTPLREILARLAPQGRSGLLPALHAAQRLYGWIEKAAAVEVGRALAVPLAEVHGVVDFYDMFHRRPAGRAIVRVCNAPVCALAGADAVATDLCRHLKTAPGEVSPNGAFTVERAPCLGLCDHAPAILFGAAAVGRVASGQ